MSIHDSWFEEKQAAWLYRRLTTCEHDPEKKRLFAALADAAESQARVWAKHAAEQGEAPPSSFRVSLRARVVVALAELLGPRAIRPVLAAMKIRGISAYQTVAHGADRRWRWACHLHHRYAARGYVGIARRLVRPPVSPMMARRASPQRGDRRRYMPI